jgi:hypothetical protein
MALAVFSVRFAKLLNSLELGAEGRDFWRQNIAIKRVTRKILQTKGLAGRKVLAGIIGWGLRKFDSATFSRTPPVSAISIS